MNAGSSVGRRTRQKNAIWRVLQAQNDFVSAKELHRLLRDSGQRIGLATVYRQLGSLHMSGSLDCIEHGGIRLYRVCLAQRRHHHHLVCEHCGRTVEISPPDDGWLKAVAAEHGFTVSSHTLEVYGLCSSCRDRSGQADVSDPPGPWA